MRSGIGIFDDRDHRIAMAAEHEGGDILHRDLELLGEKSAEARRIEHAGHAHDHVVGQTRKFAQRPHHRIQRIGDADHERIRRVRLDALADRLHHFEVDAEQIIAAHAGLAGDAGRDDDHVGTRDVGIVIGALERGIEAFDGAALGEIERLALRHAFDDVE
jgi:hypothetical protein